jgi:hypothetical protein
MWIIAKRPQFDEDRRGFGSEGPMGYTAMMVHLDVERDCEQRIQFALDLADRIQAALI